jgi:hypothetical protein
VPTIAAVPDSRACRDMCKQAFLPTLMHDVHSRCQRRPRHAAYSANSSATRPRSQRLPSSWL